MEATAATAATTAEPTRLPIAWARALRDWKGIEYVRFTWKNNPELIDDWRTLVGGMRRPYYSGQQCTSCDEIVGEICDNCGECGDPNSGCCNCVECRRCDATVSSTCDNCDWCDNCCNCVVCNSCEERRREVCSGCGTCDYCDCQCESEDCLARHTNSLRFFNGEAVKNNPSTRFLGAEVEIASSDRDSNKWANFYSKWRPCVVDDGSLPSDGSEIVIQPSSGNKWLEQVSELGASLKSLSASVDGSCGLHVHVDARDFTVDDIKSLIKIYAQIESALYAMMPSSRRSNSYCEPCGQSYSRILQGETPEVVIIGPYWDEASKRSKHGGRRYVAMNLHSWFYRGTVEFRLHGGTTNPDKIGPWGVILAILLDHAKAGKDLTGDTPYEKLVNLVSWSEIAVEYVKARTAKYGGIDFSL